MTSKLFRAIVGFGISLGTASAACLGAVDTLPEGGSPTGSGATEPAEAPDGQGPGARDGGTHEGGGNTQSDARADVADAPHDVVLDAFCDAAWPTTKGNPGGPTCGPIHDCIDAGPAPHCWQAVDAITCNSSAPGVPAWCVGGTWHCSTGALPNEACKCWMGMSSPTCIDP